MLHAQWAKEIMIQNKRVGCGGIQQSIGLPISLRPHQVTWTFRAIQSISICKSTAGMGSHDVCHHHEKYAKVGQWSLWLGQYCTSMAATGQQQWDVIDVPCDNAWHNLARPPQLPGEGRNTEKVSLRTQKQTGHYTANLSCMWVRWVECGLNMQKVFC